MHAAIPTEYRGIAFRSRLEARWAAFFDIVGWQWEYETLDGDGYIPDFVIVGANPLIVEVKPDVDFKGLIAHTPKIAQGLREVWTHDVLIVGSTPFIAAADPGWTDADVAGVLGEFSTLAMEHEDKWWWSCGLWALCPGHERSRVQCPPSELRVIHDQGSYHARPCGHHGGGHYNPARSDRVEKAWRGAGEMVRWNKPTVRVRAQ